MSKAVLISIRPKWCEKIANGEKTIEVRKTRPRMAPPFKCYIYCTQAKYPHEDFIETEYPKPQFYGGGKVIGEFTCDRIYGLETKSAGGSYYVEGGDQPTTNNVARQSCLTLREMHEYLRTAKGYGWHISDLVAYDTPRELSEFKTLCRVDADCCACPYYNYTKMDCDGRVIGRPPQSWCYVEEC
jgi:predicted transcriptional regulator|nr:MAG TPA: hypothetical protein [Caudoviricetes sp.]